MVVLKNSVPELSYILAELFNKCSKESGSDCIPVVVLKNCELELSFVY